MYRLLFSVAVLSMLCMPFAAHAAEFKQDENYFAVVEPGKFQDSDKIEVVMFLWYGCSGCYKLDPKIIAWARQLPGDIDFKRLPAMFFPQWEFHGRIFLTLEKMGASYELHHSVFTVVQEAKKAQEERQDTGSAGGGGNDFKLESDEDLPVLFSRVDLDEQEFMRIFNSDEITEKINDTYLLVQRYEVSSVPALVINGKWRFSIKDVEGKSFLELADYLIQKERDAGSGK